MRENGYCFGCMKPLDQEGRCPACGFDRKKYQSRGYHLPLGSVLDHGEYLIGKVLGEGGFGITYIGLYKTLMIPVTIKEFFPKGLVRRKYSQSEQSYLVRPVSAKSEELFRQGKRDFLQEARVLSRFGNLDGITRTRSFFEENGTAYLVLDYLEGVSVRDYVAVNGRMTPAICWQILKNPMKALCRLHENDMVHQDISPDNIMINTSGKGTLIDFGTVWSAGELSDNEELVIYKRSYSAYEQLEKHGQRGPWTDVYGLCATIYYMLTGEKPLDATERIYEDTLPRLSRMGVTLDDEVEKLIMRGLVVESADRLQSVDELYQALYHDSLIAFPVMMQQETKVSSFRWGGRQGRSCTLTSQMERKLDRMDARRRKRKWYPVIFGIAAAGVLFLFAMYMING